MGYKRLIKAFGIFALGIATVVWLDLYTHRSRDRLLKVLAEKGTVVLVPSVTEALLADLKSGDSKRMEQWYSYIYMCAHASANPSVQVGTARDAFAQYVSMEKPARSNYFNILVFALKQQSSVLSRDTLLGYLGIPDFTNGQALQYAYQYCGKDAVASAIVSNDVVVRIDIYVK